MSERRSLQRRRSSRGLARLAERRRRRRQYLYAAGGVLAVLFVGLVIWGFWQPAVRIEKVSVTGASDAVATLAKQALRGTYLHVLPRDSAFFYPASSIRRAVLGAYPGIAAVAIRRIGANELHIVATDRVAVARWCGAHADASFQQCYFFDPNGFVFATTTPIIRAASLSASSSASTTMPTPAVVNPALAASVSAPPLDAFAVYEPMATGTVPVGSTLPHADTFPKIFAFAHKLAVFGAQVRSISIRDGEIDDRLSSGTVVKYVLGQGSQAFSALNAAKSDFNLANGSVEYVDLRFSGKVYVKRVPDAGPIKN